MARLCLLALPIGLMGLATSAKADNLILNGSFEDGPKPSSPPGFTTMFGGGTLIDNWVVGGHSIDYIGGDVPYWVASHGNRSIDVGGDALGSISQTFATVIGRTYRVTFDLSGNPGGPRPTAPAAYIVRVSAGASNSEFSYTDFTNTRAIMKWQNRSWSFVADSTSTTLTFRDIHPTVAANWGPALDNVSVVLVNEPPVAVNDGYGVDQAGALVVSAGDGVLSNDVDSDNDPLTAALVSGPSNGTLALDPSGSFTYTPNIFFYGEDTFTYKANDGEFDSDVATVTITVTQPGAGGFITGGGRLAGVKRTFGFVAKTVGGGVQGNLEFQDHEAGWNIKSDSVDWVYAPNSTTGYFSGTCSVNGLAGYTFFVQLHDGPDDFTIWVFDALNNVFYTSGGSLSGGNIKIHRN